MGGTRDPTRKEGTVKKVVPSEAQGVQPPHLDSEIHVGAACPRRLIHSRDLLGEDGRVLIDHNGKFYVLRSLPGGRLILTGWDSNPVRVTGHRTALR